MNRRVRRSALPAAVLLALGMFGMLFAEDEPPATPAASTPAPSVSGELAFTETITFDYDRDGKPDRVQFWIALEGRPPSKPGAEEGSVRYFVFDVERQRRIDDWLLAFNMGEGFPVAGRAYPITDLEITGRKARFVLSGSTWTITDGGDSWEKDTIEVETGGRIRRGRFYGGDLRVVSAPPLDGAPFDIAENAECIECHRDAAVTIATSGGPHRELACAYCHATHPPDAEDDVFPQCTECHDAHTEDMVEASCVACHASHDIQAIRYGVTVPDPWCATCHEEAAETLRASRSLHVGLACVLCHQEEHGASVGCLHCHGKPHPQHVMDRPDLCTACHGTAHDLHSGRAK